MQKSKTNIVRMTVNAMLVALYIVLSLPLMTINVGGLKFTFEHFPVVLSAVIFGPLEALVVGTLGELINQLTTFGITPTTILWILPIAVRGALVGVCYKLLKNKMQDLVSVKHSALFIIVCIVSGLLSSCLNTVALYVDSKLFGYYTYEMVFGVLLMRLVLSIITSVIIGMIITPVLYALKRARLV